MSGAHDAPAERTAALLATDAAARRTAQSEFAHPLLLEAGAGTGKTSALVARVVGWALGAGWERASTALRSSPAAAALPGGAPPGDPEIAARVLGRVVAVTFTEAAAAEMASRIAETLAALATGAAPPRWIARDLLPAGDAELASRATALAVALDRLEVGTIHGFCRRLLAARPIEAGLHPRLAIDAEGHELERVAREVVEVALGSELTGEPLEGSPLLELLARRIGGEAVVGALLALAAAGLPAAALERDPFALPLRQAFSRRLLSAIESLLAAEAGRLRGSKMKKATEILGHLERLAEQLRVPASGATAAAVWAETLRERCADACDRLEEWARGKFTQAEDGAIPGDAARLSRAAAELVPLVRHAAGLDPELLDVARRALAPLLAEVQGELRRRGSIGFDGLLRSARDLLVGKPRVAAAVRAGIDQLLVDEFQDTDRLQCEIVGALALPPAGRPHPGPAGVPPPVEPAQLSLDLAPPAPERAGDGGPGARAAGAAAADRDGERDSWPGLFLVGDPKQSIYGWRNADLAAYDDFRAALVAAGGQVLALRRNFRSVPSILAEVERVLGPVMVAAPGLQPPFAPLVADRTEQSSEQSTAGTVEHWLRPAGEREDEVLDPPLEIEAAAIAADIARIRRERAVPWSEIGILLRSTTHLEVLLAALRERAIPFAVSRNRQYYRRREVIEAAALVRAVADPGDQVALLAFLRSATVGVPDAALLPLWDHGFARLVCELGAADGDGERGGPGGVASSIPAAEQVLARLAAAVGAAAAAIPPGIPGLERIAGWEASLLAGLRALGTLRRAFREQPADRFVETLRQTLALEATEAARHLGSYRLANLERFWRELIEVLEASAGDASALLRNLRQSVGEGREAPEALPQEGREDAVQVATVHAAKGLEFAHVYLPQLDRPAAGEESERTAAVERGTEWEYRLFGARSLGFVDVEAARRRVDAAELVRTLYVGMTRAADRLVLSGAVPKTATAPRPGRLPWEGARAHGELLGRRAAELALGAGEEALRGTERIAWRWLGAPLPAAVGGAAPAPAPADAAAWESVPGAAAASAERLAGARRAAAERQSRQLRGAAAGASHHLLRELRRAQGVNGEQSVGAEADVAVAVPRAIAREVALAAGTALHRGLELVDLAAEPPAALEALAAAVDTDLRRLAGPEHLAAAREVAADLLRRFAAGPLWPRLRALGPHTIARELPLLLRAPAAESAAGSVEDGEVAAPPQPIGFLSGSIDLLARDPVDGRLLVIDYKTDRIEPGAERARAAVYAAQAQVYARAAIEALSLAAPPRVELWFLATGEVITLEPEGDPAGGDRVPT